MSNLTALKLQWLPSAADGASVTPSGSAWGNSSWVQISASTPDAWTVYGIAIRDASTVSVLSEDGDFEIDIGVGAAASEVVVATLRGSREFSTVFGWGRYCLPILLGTPLTVSTSARVAVRLRKAGTDTGAWSLALGYHEGSIGADNVTSDVQKTLPSAGHGVALASGASAWVAGAWVGLTSALYRLAAGSYLVGLSIRRTYAPGSQAHHEMEIQLATGAVGAESVVASIRGFSLESGANGYQPLLIPYLVQDDARIAVRALDTDGAKSYTAALVYYGDLVAATVEAADPCVEGILGPLAWVHWPRQVPD